jgi:putative PIN family toxin of toxin-antitoxin system
MRAVVDTNVLLSGLIWRGTPHLLLQQMRAGTLSMVSSPALIAELEGVLGRPKFKAAFASAGRTPEQMLAEVRRLSEIMEPPPLRVGASRDRDDDAVLALAVAARADTIVSGDTDLLVLDTYDGIPILTPAEAMVRMERGTPERRPPLGAG